MTEHKQVATESLMNFILDGTCESTVRRYAGLVEKAAAEHYDAFDDDLVVVDTETTGFSFTNDELIQVAAARVRGGAIVDWYVTFVNPGKSIPEDVVHLTGITQQDVNGAPSPQEALTGLAAFVGKSYVVAHNVGFDKTFTTKHPGGYPLLECTWIDTLDLSRIALPRLSSHRLLDLVRAFEAPISTHRADADVEATCAILRILLAAVHSMPYLLVREIAQMATVKDWSTVEVFGYFEQRMAKELEETCSDDALKAQKAPFSLRALRRSRTWSKGGDAKKDAEALASGEAGGFKAVPKEEVERAFSADGLMGRLYQDYEQRAEQLQMATAVNKAFGASRNLVVEAGTGVGKSMAYLVPAVLMAKRNNIAVGIATKTNSLLDQLVYHELPKLAGEIPGLTYSALKGFSHYACLHKVEALAQEGPQIKVVSNKETHQASSLAALLSYIEQTDYDDLDGLKIDYRVVPRWLITTTSHDCLRRKCPFYGAGCFVHGARRQAESADVLVTNHSLLFCDLVANGGLLPTVRHWVVDEAHGTEDEARRAFSLSVAAEDLISLANRLSSGEASRNPFIRVERKLAPKGSEDESTLLFALTSKAKLAGETFAQSSRDFAKHMKDLLFFDSQRKGKGYEYVDLWLNNEIRNSATFAAMAGYGTTWMNHAEKLVLAAQNLVAYLDDLEDAASVQRDVASVAMQVKDMLTATEVVLGPQDDRYAYAATLCRKKDRPVEKLEALLVNVGPKLEETLFDRTMSVVFASATVTVDGSFDAFEGALGLNTSESTYARTIMLGSSFDFDRNMTIYVPSDMPEPNDLSYLSALENFLTRVHLAQRGSMLTLFTNRKEMERCFDAVQPKLKEEDLRLVCQKWGVSTKGLRDDFLKDESLSLFALKSFWEGFDAPGATLRGVVIPKLPFARPSDPLSCERAARDDAAWRKYVLPAAIIETKQAAGRLIRKADDKGVLILADKRLVTKSYGKAFLNSMPSKNIQVLTCSQIVEQLRDAHTV